MDHKVFSWSGFEEKVEEAPGQPQGLVAVFGYKDVAVVRNRTLDLEHWTLQCLVLSDIVKSE